MSSRQSSGDANPSNRFHRGRLAALTLVGLGISIYLALFQLELIETVWEPLFGAGSRTVLTSSFSRSLPVPDAMLGAVGYATELLLELAGPQDRWRSAPWLPLLFGVTVIVMAIISLFLVVYQVAALGTACSLCLLSAMIAWSLAAFGAREPLAALDSVRQARRRGLRLREALVGRAS